MVKFSRSLLIIFYHTIIFLAVNKGVLIKKEKMSSKFIGEKTTVDLNKETHLPIAFTWRNKRYRITSIKSVWHDYGFGSLPAPKRASWRRRHHRIYYHVETEEKKIFEIYFDWGAKENIWILVQEI